MFINVCIRIQFYAGAFIHSELKCRLMHSLEDEPMLYLELSYRYLNTVLENASEFPVGRETSQEDNFAMKL